MNNLHAWPEVKDLILFSVFFTKMIPSRVQVSSTLPSRRSWRCPGDLSTDPRHVLVDEYLGTLQLLAVPHDGRLHVVGGEGGDGVARCRLAFPLPPDPVRPHDVMCGDLYV